MGDPKKLKKKYSKPVHPWQKNRIENEKGLLKKYGLKNKKELWKAVSFRKKVADQVKRSITDVSDQGKKEKSQLLEKLQRLGILKKSAKLDDILAITTEEILNRRLQTLIYEKGLAKSVNQARQLITHGHVVVEEKKITSPSFIVPLAFDNKIGFVGTSPFNNTEHPERSLKKQSKPKLEKEEKKGVKKKEEK